MKTTIVKCNECDSVATTHEVNEDRVRFFLNGRSVRFYGVNQDQINAQIFLCECCEDDRIEKEEDYDY